ncbi:MAG: hypothetical protein WCC06_09565 [Candidatus Aminicenantales bacterium]
MSWKAFFDWVFSFVHLALLLGILVYAGVALIQANIARFGVVFGCLIGYYVLVLHPAVKKEIERKRKKDK